MLLVRLPTCENLMTACQHTEQLLMLVHRNEGKTNLGGACLGSSKCANGETRITTDEQGGWDKNGNTHTCQYPIPQQQGAWQWPFADLAFCCNAKNMGHETINLPVPLKNLFPTVGPESDTEKLDIKLDKTMGGRKDAGNSNSPDDHAFGFYIMSGESYAWAIAMFSCLANQLPLRSRNGDHDREQARWIPLGNLRLRQYCRREETNSENGMHRLVGEQQLQCHLQRWR